MSKRTRKAWTPDAVAQLQQLYANTPNPKLGQLFGRSPQAVAEKAYSMGLYKSAEHLAQHAGRLAIGAPNCGEPYRFLPGNPPWNKGKHFEPGGKSALTRFKPGQKPPKYKPVGSLRISSDGYLQRKISDTGYPPRDWMSVHRLVWELVHGPMPPGHVVVFRTGCHTTELGRISIEHVELLTRAELLSRNSVHRNGKELAALSQLRGCVNRQINRLTKKRNESPTCNPEGTA